MEEEAMGVILSCVVWAAVRRPGLEGQNGGLGRRASWERGVWACTDQHALHFPHCVASWMGCLDLGNSLLDQRLDRCRW